MGDAGGRSVGRIEAELEATRLHLAGTIDELAARAQPKEIARRQVQGMRRRFAQATRTPDGDLRVERLAALFAAGAVLLVALGLSRRRRG